MIAALFVECGGVYFGDPSIDPWDETRDARNYSGRQLLEIVIGKPGDHGRRHWRWDVARGRVEVLRYRVAAEHERLGAHAGALLFAQLPCGVAVGLARFGSGSQPTANEHGKSIALGQPPALGKAGAPLCEVAFASGA